MQLYILFVNLVILSGCWRRRSCNVCKWIGFWTIFRWLSARRSGNDWYVFCMPSVMRFSESFPYCEDARQLF